MVLEKQTFFFKNMVVYRNKSALLFFRPPPSRTIALTIDFFGGKNRGSSRNKIGKCDHRISTQGSEW